LSFLKTLLEIRTFVKAGAFSMAHKSMPSEGTTLEILLISLLDVSKIIFRESKDQ
jgi:hypothetical protein